MQEKKQKLRRADAGNARSVGAGEDGPRDPAGSAELADQRRKLRRPKRRSRDRTEQHGCSQELARLKQFYGAVSGALQDEQDGGYALAVLSSDSFTTAYKRVRYLELSPSVTSG